MRVEEMALRSEIRQMLNEAGFNKNTLKFEVKSVLKEEIEKAVRQAINETDFNGYVRRETNSIIRDATISHLKNTITRQIVGDWFSRMRISIDVTNKTGESILMQEEKEPCLKCVEGEE